MKLLYRIFQTFSRRVRSIDPRLGLMVLVMIAILLTGTAWIGSAPHSEPTSTPVSTSAPFFIGGTPTPLPAELLNNKQQTIGLTLAAAILVLIVVIAVLNALVRNPGDN